MITYNNRIYYGNSDNIPVNTNGLPYQGKTEHFSGQMTFSGVSSQEKLIPTGEYYKQQDFCFLFYIKEKVDPSHNVTLVIGDNIIQPYTTANNTSSGNTQLWFYLKGFVNNKNRTHLLFGKYPKFDTSDFYYPTDVNITRPFQIYATQSCTYTITFNVYY